MFIKEKFLYPKKIPFGISLKAYTCGALRDLVAFVQFKNRKKHPWRRVNFSKVAG